MSGKPGSDECQHIYRLFNDIEGEWKLIWECIECGSLFMCKCFQKAMDGRSKASKTLSFPIEHDIKKLSEMKGVSEEEMKKLLTGVRYKGMSCEICLDNPSTHNYSRDLQGSDEFQRRYGAYIMKQAIEMVLNGKSLPDQKSYLHEAEEMVRMMYGFREKDDIEIDLDLLPRLVKTLFPDIDVLVDHKPDWLHAGLLQVYLPQWKLAIENRDKSHYELLTTDSNNPARLKRQQEEDRRLESECGSNGIDLLVIPYYKELDRDSLLWKLCELRPGLKRD